jgi:hypothetical protein
MNTGRKYAFLFFIFYFGQSTVHAQAKALVLNPLDLSQLKSKYSLTGSSKLSTKIKAFDLLDRKHQLLLNKGVPLTMSHKMH